MSKGLIRENYIFKRAGLKTVRGEYDNKITSNLINFLDNEMKDKKSLSVYVSMGSEVSTRNFIESKNNDYKMCFPNTDSNNNMEMYKAKIFTGLNVDKKGNVLSLEKLELNKEDIIVPDVVIVPMVAYNKKLHRVGYGLGCYDKYFEVNPSCVKIGLAYDEQEADFEANDLDIPLDYIITQSKVIKASNR